ncbi:MAG TPA: putative zinc-binding metallopeptidase [Candidatus Binatia bacterium]
MWRHHRRAAKAREPRWASYSDEELLDLRLCDLAPDLSIEGTWLEARIEQLYRELERCGIVFRPHFWLSDDWFTPEGVPGIAIPFYLAHPRLARLEEAQMLEVEGGTPEWCMRILRHETGHAIDNAFRLRRLRRRQQLFGRSTVPYPESYAPRPYSRNYVLHLENWYAQSHPDEDFAETFAVWMTPRSAWRRTYAGWPALKKLEYVDELMWELAGKTPPVANRRQVEPLRTLKRTLREHYAKKRERYGRSLPDFADQDLRRLFSDSPAFRDRPTAASFLRRVRKQVTRRVARTTGAYQYAVDQVLEDIISRCRALNLRLTAPEEQTMIDFAILLAVHTMSSLTRRSRVVM